MTTYVGLDLSLTSPAMAIIGGNNNVTLYGFQQRKRETPLQLITINENTELMLLPAIPTSKMATTISRIAHVCKHLIAYINMIQGKKEIFIEDHAFSADSGHSTRLHELVGAMKLTLHNNDNMFTVIGISRWKKIATGKGNSKKLATLQWAEGFVQRAHGERKQEEQKASTMTLLDSLGLKIGKGDTVPHPIEDICDALGVAVAGRIESTTPSKDTNKSKKNTKKRKREV